MPVYAEKEKINGQTRWYVRTYIKDPFGNAKQITKHNKDWIGRNGKIEAQQEEFKIKNQSITEKVKTKNISIKKLEKMYLDFLEGKVDEDTLYNKKVYLSHFCELDKTNQVKTYPDTLVRNWTSNQFLIWEREMKRKKYEKKKNVWELYSIEHLNRIYCEICCMIDFAINHGYCSLNFAKQAGKIGTPKEIKMSNVKKEYNVINIDEFKKLLDVSKDNLKYNVYFELAFKRGPRPGEMRAFRCKDFDYNKKQLMVNHTISKIKTLKEPKTAASKAPIDLDDSLNEKIKLLIDEHKEDENYNEDWFIFGKEKPLSANSINKAKNKYFKLAGIKQHLRLHDFRHSCATWQYSVGIPITVISKILRHANIDETMKTYTHLFQEDYNNNIDKINLLLKETS